MKAAERERRDAQVIQLWLSGASHRSIAAVVGLRSHRTVGNIVHRALGSSSQRRALLTDEAFAVWQERSERLFRAHWGPALDGNYRSAELCRRLLAQQATVYVLGQQVPVAGTKLDAVVVDKDQDDDGGDGMDILSRMRADRALADAARCTVSVARRH